MADNYLWPPLGDGELSPQVCHPISAARLVMERSPHVMLAGEGARWFAEQQVG